MYRSIDIPKTQSVWKKMFAFFGPGLLIAVGYMDPGNWATDIAGGAQFALARCGVAFRGSRGQGGGGAWLSGRQASWVCWIQDRSGCAAPA